MNDHQKEIIAKLLGHICMSCGEVLCENCAVCDTPTWCSSCGVDYVGRFFTPRDIMNREQEIYNGVKAKHTYMMYGIDCCEKCEEKSEVLDIDRLDDEGWLD